MIEINGCAMLSVKFSVKFSMSIEEWEGLSEDDQNNILDSHIDWHEACRHSEIYDIEIYNHKEVTP